MKQALRSRSLPGVLAAAMALAAVPAAAQPAPSPTVQTYFSVDPIPFQQPRLAAETAATRAQPEPRTSAGSTPAEIVELTRALNNDPYLIYQYVHDNVQFSPLWGALKGPVGTLLDGRGDSFDQAALMVALLNQASLTNTSISNVLFEIGELSLNSAQLQSWLGVDSNPYSVAGVFAQGAIPSTVYTNGSALVGHVWVKVSINGTAYVFDPAFKAQTYKAGIVSNLANIMGYTQSQFLSDAGGTVTSTSIQGVNRTQLRTDLTTYTNNLAAYIRANAPTAGVSDILGGGTIVPVPLVNGKTVPQTSNPNVYGTPHDTSSIPTGYLATLQVTLPGAAAQTYYSNSIYGHRLSILFNTSYVPTLYLDGVAQVSGSAQVQDAQVPIQLATTGPSTSFGSWDVLGANQTRIQYVTAQSSQSGAGYIVPNGWDQVGRGMIEKHRTLLNQAIKAGNAANSEVVLGESLEVLGLSWLAECAAQQRISDQLLGTTTQYFYGGGIAGQAGDPSGMIFGPYVDLRLNFIDTPTRVNGAQTQTANSLAAFLDASGTASSFESATLEQTQAQTPGFVAVSTAKLLDIGVQNGDTIFDINNGNTGATQQYYTNTIRPQMAQTNCYPQMAQTSCYKTTDLAGTSTAMGIDQWVGAGYRVIAPLHGQIAVNSWTGVGYKTMETTNNGGDVYGEIISGGLSGGFATVNDLNLPGNTVAAQTPPSTWTYNSFINSVGGTLTGNGLLNVGDPIDHVKGSYQYQHEDLAVGAKSFPYGLSFERSYDSGAQAISGPLGGGWTHNLAITAAANSDGFAGLGQATPLSAASSIAALYVSSNLVNGQAIDGQANLEYFVLEAVVNRWFTDQLTQNVITVTQGWNSEEFTKMTDGTYAPPVGSAAILDAPGGDFRYRTKSGVTMNFNPAGQISSWTNAAGASVAFNYSGNELSSISNSATGRQLSLSYGSGGQISAVSDGSRTVSYSYTNGNLTTFTDALGQNTTFAYDTSGTEDTAGHLTQVFYPSNPSNAFVTNFYDSLGRVKQQKDANGNLSLTLIAGARTEIDDPVGNRHAWYNDARGNVLMEIQDYGYSPHLNITTTNVYDGQSNLAMTTLPEGNSISYVYNAEFNPVTVTQTPKPGSSLSPLVKSFTYTWPVSSLPNFEEIHTSADANGNVTTYNYNSSGNVTEIDQPAVTKPGVQGSQTPKQTFTYTSIGLPQTATDAEGRVTQYAYNSTYADEVVKSTIDYGRLNLITQYGYDAYGDVTSVTDANGYVTTSKFDNLRRLTEADGAVAGVVTKYTYFPDGQIATQARQISTNTFETTQYAYTLSDKAKTVTDPLGNTVTTAYDADDRKQTVTTQVSSSQNRQRTYSYDALSRLYQVSDTTSGSPGTVLETHAYSPNGNQVTFTDANSHSTAYLYDGVDRLSQTTYPDSGTEKYSYDSNGNPLQKTARSGQTITFTYDALNRVATKTPQGEVAGQVTYGYDLTGLLLQASDTSSSSPYQIAYDTAGRANSFTDQQGRNTQAQYDGVGNRTSLQWPAGTNGSGSFVATYNFDALNRMMEIDANGSPDTPLARYQWDALSRLGQIVYGDGTYDLYSQYDAGDNLLTLTEGFADASGDVTFTYGWLKNHQRQSTAVNNASFQYAPPAGTTTYGTADVDNGYTTVGAATFTYDGNHNLTYDGFNTLMYDVENRLIQAQNGIAGTSTYLYDPLGHRKQKQVGSAITQFVLAGNDEIADYAGSGAGTGHRGAAGSGDHTLDGRGRVLPPRRAGQHGGGDADRHGGTGGSIHLR